MLSLMIISCAVLSFFQARASLEEKFPAQVVATPKVKELRVGIVRAQWNVEIVDSMFLDCLEELLAHGVQSAHIKEVTVPGSLELSFGAEKLFLAEECDICICLGAIIEGAHHLWVESLAHATVKNISDISMLFAKPVICGVVICTQHEAERLVNQHIGAAWARSALMMSSM